MWYPISKYYIIILLFLLGTNALKGQDRLLAKKQHSCKKLPASEAVWICFEQFEQLVERHQALFTRLSALKGRLECQLRLSLKKEKIKAVRLFWESEDFPRLKFFQRYLLRKIFQKIQFEVVARKHLKGIYKVSWVCAMKNGDLELL